MLGPDDDGEDLLQDPVLTGHPLHHLLAKSRLFLGEFRERRLPTAPGPEFLAQLPKDRPNSQLKTYARRIIRATAPLLARNGPNGAIS